MCSRLSLLILLLGGAFSIQAQQNIHYFGADDPLDEVEVRSIIEAAHDVDPHAEVLHHFDDRSLIQINTNPSVTNAELRQSIASYGVVLRPGTPDVPRDQPVYTRPDGRPLYVLTGDAAADRARYEQAVNEWNSNNPNDRIELPMRPDNDQ